MMTIVFLMLGIVMCVLQTTLLQMIPGTFTRPDLVFLLVAFAAYKFPWVTGILLAFVVGWVLDVLVGINLGIYPLKFLFVFVSLKMLSLNSPVKESAYQIPLVGISYFLLQIIGYLYSSVATHRGSIGWSWGGMVQETILLALAAVPIFVLLNGLYDYLERRAARSRSVRRRRVRKSL